MLGVQSKNRVVTVEVAKKVLLQNTKRSYENMSTDELWNEMKSAMEKMPKCTMSDEEIIEEIKAYRRGE
ncbi:MAG: hypothetical protein MJY63_06160 [Paludibacteraceae bacterium]|nr:hypothetical protein [Paludibacteraceae bacterium]